MKFHGVIVFEFVFKSQGVKKVLQREMAQQRCASVRGLLLYESLLDPIKAIKV